MPIKISIHREKTPSILSHFATMDLGVLGYFVLRSETDRLFLLHSRALNPCAITILS
jgi:hypothetical protein